MAEGEIKTWPYGGRVWRDERAERADERAGEEYASRSRAATPCRVQTTHLDQIVNTSSTWSVVNDAITAINGYKGGVYQQATSGVSNTDQVGVHS
jgi:hypothetical protein